MIRIITAKRMRRLVEEVEQAREAAADANGRAAERYRRHVARVDHLNGCIASAESDAAILREHVTELEAALKESVARAAALREDLTVARLVAMMPVTLLLRDGTPHSVHASVQAAKDHAATLGANPAGWMPPGTEGGTLTGWSITEVPRGGGGS